jgi:hypothetical protein
MEYLRIKKFSESEFDTVVEKAGGARIATNGSADYLFKDAVVELKLVMEEGLEKRTRQIKLANFFRERQPGRPVVVVDPQLLDEVSLRAYHNIVSGPIKTHVKKAARQLEATSQRYSPVPARVLIILNIGYTALSPDEFRAVSVKCAQNDTTKIDWIICGGVYFYSDKFDSYVIAPLEGVPIDVRRSLPLLQELQKSWAKFVEEIVADSIKVKAAVSESRMPLIDLTFDVDGIRYVKPSPKMPKSDFWPSGMRPRDNSSGIDQSPTVARTFPSLSERNWNYFRRHLGRQSHLQSSYGEWVNFQGDQERKLNQKLKPFVPVDVDYEEFTDWASKSSGDWRFSDICRFASHLFELRIREVLGRLKDKEQLTIVLPEFIELLVTEIGQDKANDLASISYVSEMSASPKRDTIFENERIFFEYGVTLAASYAVKRNVGVVVYIRQQFPLN